MTDEQKFIKGFNHGYILQGNEADLLENVLKTPNDQNEYFQGLKWGSRQMIQDRFIQQMKDNEQSQDYDLSL